jgi:hypothetical protein
VQARWLAITDEDDEDARTGMQAWGPMGSGPGGVFTSPAGTGRGTYSGSIYG